MFNTTSADYSTSYKIKSLSTVWSPCALQLAGLLKCLLNMYIHLSLILIDLKSPVCQLCIECQEEQTPWETRAHCWRQWCLINHLAGMCMHTSTQAHTRCTHALLLTYTKSVWIYFLYPAGRAESQISEEQEICVCMRSVFKCGITF